MNCCRGASQKWARRLCMVCLHICQLIILILIVSDPPVIVWRWNDPWSWFAAAILSVVIVSIDTMIVAAMRMLLGIVKRKRPVDIFTLLSGVVGLLGIIFYILQLFKIPFWNTAFYVIVPLFTLFIWGCWLCRSYKIKKK